MEKIRERVIRYSPKHWIKKMFSIMNNWAGIKDKIKREYKNLTINLNKMEGAIKKTISKVQMSKTDWTKSVRFSKEDSFQINLCNLARNLNNLHFLLFLDFLLITTWIIRLVWLMKVLDSHQQVSGVLEV